MLALGVGVGVGVFWGLFLGLELFTVRVTFLLRPGTWKLN